MIIKILCLLLVTVLGTLFYFSTLSTAPVSLDDHPFLKVGSPVDSGKIRSLSSSDVQAYQNAMRKFVIPQDCIEQTQDLSQSKLRWDKIGDLEELEVCLFLIANDLLSSDLLAAFLQANNFQTPEFRSMDANEMRFYEAKGAGLQTMTLMKGKDIPSALLGFFSFLRPYTMPTSVISDFNGRPLDVNIGFVWL